MWKTLKNEGQSTVLSLETSKAAGEMVPWANVLSVKPDDLTSVSGTHLTEGENWLRPAAQAVLWWRSQNSQHKQTNVIKHF